jgi:hypothetical protein
MKIAELVDDECSKVARSNSTAAHLVVSYETSRTPGAALKAASLPLLVRPPHCVATVIYLRSICARPKGSEYRYGLGHVVAR